MNLWCYLAFGFGLLFTWLRKEGSGALGSEGIREIGFQAFRLMFAVGTLVLLTSLLNFLIWEPSGRNDLGRVSFFLWALLIDEGMRRLVRRERRKEKDRIVVSRFFLALTSFSLWILEGTEKFPSPERFLWGLGLPFGMGIFMWLLAGLRHRVKLSNLPPFLEGTPILFWLATLLSLALSGIQKLY